MADVGASGPPGGFERPSFGRRAIKRILPQETRQAIWVQLVMRDHRVFRLYSVLDPSVRSHRLTRHTDLLVEGYPRSANTYFQKAFEHANGTRFRVAHHLHSPTTVGVAAHLGVPALVLVREPGSVLGSMLQFNAQYDPIRVLNGYRAYYERLLPHTDACVIAEFQEVIKDPGAVIGSVNARFGTTFLPYRRSESAESSVWHEVERDGRTHDPRTYELTVSRPSDRRRSAAEFIGSLSPSEKDLLSRASELYERLIAAR